MAGLDDLNANYPSGTEDPTLGDDRIRAIIAKLQEWAEIEHDLAGPHKFLYGDLSSRPAFGYPGRIYILIISGLATEVQRDTGSAWETITSNQTVLNWITDLAAHIAVATLPHASRSVTSIKIAKGAITAEHLDSGESAASIAALVNGNSADALHTHPQYIPVGTPGVVEPYDLTDLSDGFVVHGYAPTERVINNAFYQEYKRIKTKRAGAFKVYFTLRGIGTCSIYAQVYKNGVDIGIERTLSFADVEYGEETFVESFAGFVVDDIISVYCKVTGIGYVKEFKVCAQWDMETVVD